MPNVNFQKFKHYKELVEIDYFTYFTKCYLALNAYIKAKFEGNDREKIDKLKEDVISQKRFKELFVSDTFIANLKDFKQALYIGQIKNENIVASFQRVKIQSFNPKSLTPINKNQIIYNLKIVGGKDEKVEFECLGKNNDVKEKKQCKYSELGQILNQTKLSKTQRDIIKSTFDREINQYHQDLTATIDSANNNSSDEDKSIIYKGFVEIIYLLRNALFHSEIDPTQEAIQKVYRLAYVLFKDFIYKAQDNLSSNKGVLSYDSYDEKQVYNSFKN